MRMTPMGHKFLSGSQLVGCLGRIRRYGLVAGAVSGVGFEVSQTHARSSLAIFLPAVVGKR